jgi:branched-chain amino acid transport system substrate-binding protein
MTTSKERGAWVFVILTVITCFWMAARVHAAEVRPVKVAIVDPLSGAYSRNGNLAVQGTKAMMNWINEKGGIKSLGGAKLVPVVADNKSTVEGAANGMERVCRDPDILIAQPSWGSSFTMAATEVTERLGIPSFSTGGSEKLHERGFKYGFYPCPGFLTQMKLGMPVMMEMFKSAGKDLKTQFIASSNNVSDMLFCEGTQKYLEERGVKTVGKEVWPIGTLTDATPIMQKIKTADPDIVIFGGSALAEAQMFIMKKKELKMKKTIFICSSGWMGDPSLSFGGEYMDSWFGFTPFFPNKRTPQEWITKTLDQVRKEYANEPWIGLELSMGMNLVPVYAEALERAASRDRNVIAETIRKMDLHDISATRNYAKNGVSFDETGRISKKYEGVVIIQWQSSVCKVVYPEDMASVKPRVNF